jgi:hypothetical protein
LRGIFAGTVLVIKLFQLLNPDSSELPGPPFNNIYNEINDIESAVYAAGEESHFVSGI